MNKNLISLIGFPGEIAWQLGELAGHKLIELVDGIFPEDYSNNEMTKENGKEK